MGATRSIERIIPPQETHWVGDGFRVHNFFPYGLDEQRMSPFYLLDYNSKYYFEPSTRPRGVGPHPHRGFETVTIAFKGKVAHHDSRGNSGVIGEGDVQWMTAGSGILHKEYHEEEFNRTGGDFQMIQLWVNLPAKDKMTEPKYQAILNAEFGRYKVPDGLGVIEVLAGEYEGVKGPASTFSPIQIYIGKVKKGAKLDFSTPSNYNTALVILEGSLSLDGTDIPTDNFALFANDGDSFSVEAVDDAIFFILSGDPLDEPIASYGPFVMNTQDEIRQAMKDFGSGMFGNLD
ncbi:MAG: pirin family protein [Acidobacteriota bacterium]